jgi:hypothetical protein
MLGTTIKMYKTARNVSLNIYLVYKTGGDLDGPEMQNWKRRKYEY